MAEINWDQVPDSVPSGASSSGGEKGESRWAKLVQGENVFRFVSKIHDMDLHWEGTKQCKCAGPGCPLCQKLTDKGVKNYPRPYYLALVISRATGKLQILQFCKAIALGIKNLYVDADWGDTRNYDVKIIRGAPKTNPLYTVTAKPKTPLKEEELAMAATCTWDLAKMSVRNTIEQVKNFMEGKPFNAPAGGATTSAAKVDAPPTASVSVDDTSDVSDEFLTDVDLS